MTFILKIGLGLVMAPDPYFHTKSPKILKNPWGYLYIQPSPLGGSISLSERVFCHILIRSRVVVVSL